MDFMKWVKNNKWIVLIILYVIAIIFQFHSNKWGFLGTSAGIGLIIALISTLFTYSNLIKKFIRKTKFFIGPSMFKWEATSSFNIRSINFSSVKKEENNVIKIIKEALKDNDLDENIDVSYDRSNNLKILIKEYVMYLDIFKTDIEAQDELEFALNNITIKVDTALRYRDKNKVINGLLLDIYHGFEKKYAPHYQKYTIKLNVERISNDFLKKHFINEYNPDEVTYFNISSKTPRATEEITNNKLALTTNRREELSAAINKLILRLS